MVIDPRKTAPVRAQSHEGDRAQIWIDSEGLHVEGLVPPSVTTLDGYIAGKVEEARDEFEQFLVEQLSECAAMRIDAEKLHEAPDHRELWEITERTVERLLRDFRIRFGRHRGDPDDS